MTKGTWIGGVLALSLGAGVAFAQDDGRLFRPEWLEKPSGRQLAGAFPGKAIRAGQSGLAVLCCVPEDDGRLTCALASEWPGGFGFGQGARRLARHYRWSAQSVAEFRSRALPPYKLKLPMTLEPLSEEMQEVLDRANAIADRPEVCALTQPTN